MFGTRIVGKCENCEHSYDLYIVDDSPVECPRCKQETINYDDVNSVMALTRFAVAIKNTNDTRRKTTSVVC